MTDKQFSAFMFSLGLAFIGIGLMGYGMAKSQKELLRRSEATTIRLAELNIEVASRTNELQDRFDALANEVRLLKKPATAPRTPKPKTEG